MKFKRTKFCGEVNKHDVGSTVNVAGWVHRRRDHGSLIFVDLRDRSGIVQATFDVTKKNIHSLAEQIRPEFVIAVKGKVIERKSDTVNLKLATGEIEVEAEEIEILNHAKTPPFEIADPVTQPDESIRLKHRYLDLRRPDIQYNFLLRHRVVKAARDLLDKEGFWEVETPMLTKSTPEGARDYLVPSRLNPGCFYALPQSPQLFKQILMVSGFEKYFQIVKCFRDEDLRADRQPEFTQIDIEMSFVDEEDVLSLIEKLIANIIKELEKIHVALPLKKVTTPFPRLTYDEAMSRYGTDKPDTRFGLELISLTDIARHVEFKVFNEAVKKGGEVRGINGKGCGSFSRSELDAMVAFSQRVGAKGMAWISIKSKVKDQNVKLKYELQSPIVKFFKEEELQAIVERMHGEPGDVLFFVADKSAVVLDVLSQVRLELGKKLNLIDPKKFNFLWVTDFPLLEYSESEKRLVSRHHPFTEPKREEADVNMLETDPLKVKARAYDIVLNGTEIGGGSIRIHNRNVQKEIFKILGMSDKEAQEKFGFLLQAFEYGAPPHGGIALGLDRFVAMLAGCDSIREVIAFPKTQSASCPMSGAPGHVDDQQLKELNIKTIPPEK